MKSQFSFIYAAVTRLLSVCIIGETPDGGGGGLHYGTEGDARRKF